MDRLRRIGIGAWAVALLAASCGGAVGGPDGGTDGGPDGSGMADAVDVPGVPGADPAAEGALDVPCPPALEKVDPPEMPVEGFDLTLVLNGDRDVRVRALACGKPAADVEVRWTEVEDPDDLCELQVEYSWTGEDGVAVARVRNVNEAPDAACVLEACAGVGTCLQFRIHAGGCGLSPPLVVGFAPYVGHWPKVNAGTVYLYRQKADGRPRCADVTGDGAIVTASDKKGPVSLMSTVQFPNLPDLQEEGTQAYTVRCVAAEGTGPARAQGCLDDVTVEWGARTFVECPLPDIRPKLAGAYDLRSTFDLVTGLPPAAKAVLDLGASAVTAPLPLVLLLACDPAVAAEGTSARAFCQALFQDPANPAVDALTAVGEVVARRIRANLEALPLYACGAEGDGATCPGLDPLFFGNDRSWRGLQAVELASVMTCAHEPGPDGVVATGGCTEAWETATLRGLPGTSCPVGGRWCREVGLPLAPGAGPVTASLDVALDTQWRLSVARHEVGVRYGALADRLMESAVLPAFFGDGKDGLPAVETWEAWIASLLSGRGCLQVSDCCESFGTALAAGAPGVVAAVAEGACDQWVDLGGTRLRTFFQDLDDAPTALQLATPAGAPCALDDANADLRFDALGSAAAPCTWEAEWLLGQAYFGPAATFTGNRH